MHYNISQHIKTQIKNNRKVDQGIALKRVCYIYLNQNHARFTYSDHAHLFSEFNMIAWSGERRGLKTKCARQEARREMHTENPALT